MNLREKAEKRFSGENEFKERYGFEIGFLAGQSEAKKEIDDRLKRTVTASYHALLEMSAFLGIPEKKRLMQVEYLMENVRFCAENDVEPVSDPTKTPVSTRNDEGSST